MARKKDRTPLSPAEWEVMKVLWRQGPLAARDISALLAKEQDWAHSTVKTLLRRMVQKEWLDFERVGNSYLYRAAVPQNRAVPARVREFASRLMDGVASPFVTYLAKADNLSGDDLDHLRRIIERHDRKGGQPDATE